MASIILDSAKPTEAIWGSLPSRMRALFVTTPSRTGAWLAEAFAADSAAQVVLEEASGSAAGLARLRDEVFDAVFVTHEPPELDALVLSQAIRAGGAEEALLLLGTADDQEMTPLAFEVGADDFLCVHSATVRALLWSAARAIERHHLIRDNRRLIQAERQRLQYEHQEADRLISQQRALITDLESLRAAEPPRGLSARSPKAGNLHLPENLVAHYSELLRAYVIMGSGNLTSEMTTLAELLATAGVTSQQTMLLHLKALEELIQGLGSRSARHVMSRADLLVLEVMMHLGENYRRRYMDRHCPAEQLLLPGFEKSAHDEAA